jgi:hypothetical protein
MHDMQQKPWLLAAGELQTAQHGNAWDVKG